MVYTTLRKKIKDDFSFTKDTRKIQERLKQKKKKDTRKINLGFSLGRLFEYYNRIELKYSKEFQSSILEQVDIFLEPSIRESDKMRSSTFQCKKLCALFFCVFYIHSLSLACCDIILLLCSL